MAKELGSGAIPSVRRNNEPYVKGESFVSIMWTASWSRTMLRLASGGH